MDRSHRLVFRTPVSSICVTTGFEAKTASFRFSFRFVPSRGSTIDTIATEPALWRLSPEEHGVSLVAAAAIKREGLADGTVGAIATGRDE